MPTTAKFFRVPPLVLIVLAALATSLMMAVVLARPAQAATLTVTTSVDELNTDGDCSLREAIEAANTNAAVDGCAAGSDTELDTIVFSVGQEATISLGSELDQLLITDDAGLTITGQQNNITISGEDAGNDSGGVFRVEPGAVFNLRSLTVADGNSSTFAGALLNNGGEVEVRNSTFSGNSATDNSGAIENGGTMTVTNSTFSGNSADGVGGGILNTGGTLTVSNSTFSGNNAAASNGGSGIYNEGSLEVINSTFSGNGTGGGGGGGGITNGNGMLTVTNSTFSGNSSTDTGGGISNSGGGELTVTNSTISGNSAEFGGGIANFGTLTVTNSTFSGNSATNAGGGIFVEFSTATLKNTIVANSTQGGNCTGAFGGTIVDGGYNVEDADTCGFSAANNSQPSTDPKLDALAANGGPTQTFALKPASPAINAIPSAINGCSTAVTTDQRGLSRPQGGKCEIGSFEDKSPSVRRVVPLENATGVPPATNVSVFFSEAMKGGLINPNTVKLFSPGTTTPLAAAVSYDAATKKATLNPNANLQAGTRYKAVVTTGARDLAGNQLDQDQDPSNGNQQKVWFFTVRN